jgi:hypothetical protein
VGARGGFGGARGADNNEAVTNEKGGGGVTGLREECFHLPGLAAEGCHEPGSLTSAEPVSLKPNPFRPRQREDRQPSGPQELESFNPRILPFGSAQFRPEKLRSPAGQIQISYSLFTRPISDGEPEKSIRRLTQIDADFGNTRGLFFMKSASICEEAEGISGGRWAGE